MLDIKFTDDDGQATLRGQLIFTEQAKFREAASRLMASRQHRLILDFAGLDFIDSAGLGMLLLLREEAGRSGREVVLRGPQNQVRRMFDVSRFGTLFVLET